jgi:hypothetical protein
MNTHSISPDFVRTDEIRQTDHFSAHDESGLRYSIIEYKRITTVSAGSRFIRMTPSDPWYRTSTGSQVRKQTETEFEISATGARLKRN